MLEGKEETHLSVLGITIISLILYGEGGKGIIQSFLSLKTTFSGPVYLTLLSKCCSVLCA